MIDCAPHIHVAAYHSTAGYNNNTPGIGVLCPMTADVQAAVGTYYNSMRKQSVYAAIVYQPLSVGPFKIGGIVGAVTGYKERIIPLAAVALTLPVGNAGLHLILAPPADTRSPAVAEFSVSYHF